MKLLFCPHCHDVRKLGFTKTKCKCGKSWGKYLKDGIQARYGSGTIPLGFHNQSFEWAIRGKDSATPERGVRFEAFVISEKSRNIRMVE